MSANQWIRTCQVTALAGTLACLAACGQQNTARQTVLAQDSADAQAKYQDLSPAEGNFTGTVTLLQTNQSFTMNLQIERVYQTTHSPDSTDPSDTIKIPKLSGNMNFPALDNIAQSDDTHFSQLLEPMGNVSRVTFDYGDFTPNDSLLVLPYAVPKFSGGDYGQLSGTLINGHYSGSWFSKPFGVVASFELDKS